MQLCNHVISGSAASMQSRNYARNASTTYHEIRQRIPLITRVRFRDPVSIPLITLQYTRVEYELTKLDVVSQIDGACSLTKLATGRGGKSGSDPICVLNFRDFGGIDSLSVRSRSVRGEFRQ